MNLNEELPNTIKLTPGLLAIILLLITLMQATTDLYLPSLPAIATFFSSTESTIQLTLSMFMLGLSLSHIFYGPLSDRIGRRPPILLGVLLSVLGSLVCYLAPSVEILILGRFIQGMGIGSCNSVGRSLARDLMTDRMLAKVGSYVGMVTVFILALSPVVGGYIHQHLGWRANFLGLVVFGLVMVGVVYRWLPETNQHRHRNATQFTVMIKNYLMLIQNKVFLGYTLCACFAGAGLVSYLTIAPFLFENTLQLSPSQFGWMSCFIAVAIFCSGLINSRLVVEKGITKMVRLGIELMIAGALLLLVMALYHWMSVLTIMIPVALFSMGAGFTFMNAFAGAFHPFPKIAGTAGALYACLQDLSAAIASGVIAAFQGQGQMALAIMLLVMGLASLIAWNYRR